MSTLPPAPEGAEHPPATHIAYAGLSTEQLIGVAAVTQAAHAVVGALWQFDITEVRIYQVPATDAAGGIGYAGRTSYASSRIPHIEGIAYLNAAGSAAVRRYLGEEGLPDLRDLTSALPGGHNLEAAQEQLAAAGVAAVSWEAVVQQVDLTLERLWPQVEQVASRLRTSFAVSGDLVRSVLADNAWDVDLAAMADASRQAPQQATDALPRADSLQRLIELARRITANARLRAPRGHGAPKPLPDAQSAELQQQRGERQLRGGPA
ncbi:MAG: hypothetical protein ABR532_03655 [Candidatus Dormibacteria bacterium]